MPPRGEARSYHDAVPVSEAVVIDRNGEEAEMLLTESGRLLMRGNPVAEMTPGETVLLGALMNEPDTIKRRADLHWLYGQTMQEVYPHRWDQFFEVDVEVMFSRAALSGLIWRVGQAKDGMFIFSSKQDDLLSSLVKATEAGKPGQPDRKTMESWLVIGETPHQERGKGKRHSPKGSSGVVPKPAAIVEDVTVPVGPPEQETAAESEQQPAPDDSSRNRKTGNAVLSEAVRGRLDPDLKLETPQSRRLAEQAHAMRQRFAQVNSDVGMEGISVGLHDLQSVIFGTIFFEPNREFDLPTLRAFIEQKVGTLRMKDSELAERLMGTLRQVYTLDRKQYFAPRPKHRGDKPLPPRLHGGFRRKGDPRSIVVRYSSSPALRSSSLDDPKV